MLSDVIGDDPGVIGSGPSAPDASTFSDVAHIFEKYGIREKLPSSVRERIDQGVRGDIAETPKPGDAIFKGVRNTIVGSNLLALEAAARRARQLGFRALVLSSEIQGETREVARMHAAIAREVISSGQPAKPPVCLISGGETTVTLKGKGLGGRNQEFVLAAALDLEGLPDTVVLSAGTDGTDGPTDAAGAIADGETVRRGPRAASFLNDNDSYHYFEQLDDLIKTGPTLTNVMDVRLLLIGSGK